MPRFPLRFHPISSVMKTYRDMRKSMTQQRYHTYTLSSFESKWKALDRSVRGMGMCCSGRHLTIYPDSGDAFREMWREIDEAKQSIKWQTYICKDDNVGKISIGKLVAACKRGVRVELLYDCLGNITGRENLTEPLSAVGGNVIPHRPVFTNMMKYFSHGLKWHLSPGIRNHRKILIVDGVVGFTGGLNIGDDYCAKALGGNGRFRDTHCKVTGPAVAQLDVVFEDTKNPIVSGIPWSYSRSERNLEQQKDGEPNFFVGSDGAPHPTPPVANNETEGEEHRRKLTKLPTQLLQHTWRRRMAAWMRKKRMKYPSWASSRGRRSKGSSCSLWRRLMTWQRSSDTKRIAGFGRWKSRVASSAAPHSPAPHVSSRRQRRHRHIYEKITTRKTLQKRALAQVQVATRERMRKLRENGNTAAARTKLEVKERIEKVAAFRKRLQVAYAAAAAASSAGVGDKLVVSGRPEEEEESGLPGFSRKEDLIFMRVPDASPIPEVEALLNSEPSSGGDGPLRQATSSISSQEQKKEPAEGEGSVAPVNPPSFLNSTTTQMIMANPHSKNWSLQVAIWAVTCKVHRRLWVTTPYYFPHRELMKAIVTTAGRGVDVRILAGSSTTTDPGWMWYASGYVTLRMLRSGVRVYEYQGDQILHAKTMVADSIFSSVGSYNWDVMSNYNMENIVVSMDPVVAKEMESQFLIDLGLAKELTEKDFLARSIWYRVLSVTAFYFMKSCERFTFYTYRDANLTSRLD